MHLLVASIIPLLLGPALVWILQRARWAAEAIDAFVLASVSGLLLLAILPDAILHGGVLAVIALVIGAFLPKLAPHGFSEHSTARTLTYVAGILGLFIHATLDGIALAAPGHGEHGDSPLALAVALHRLPVGLAIWWLIRPRYGFRVAISAVLAISVASILGYFWFHRSLEWIHGPTICAFQALVAGSLFHVAAGHSDFPPNKTHTHKLKIPSALGTLLGIAIVAMVSQAHPLEVSSPLCHGFGESFMSLALAAAPWVLAAYLITAMFRAIVPNPHGNWLHGSSPLCQTLLRANTDIPTSTCACTISPLYESLVKKGIPPYASTALLLATPILGLTSVMVSLCWLGVRLTAIRVASALLLTIFVSALIGKSLARASRIAPTGDTNTKWSTRIRSGLRYGFVDVPDRTLPWFAAGLLAAALLESMLDPVFVQLIPQHLGIPAFALVAMPVFISALGATPVAAVLIHKGVSVGAIVAFAITGPAVNVSTYTILRLLHGHKLAIAYFIIVVGTAIGLGFTIDLLITPTSESTIVDILQQEPPTPINTASLTTITLLALISLLRRGAHGFVSQLVEPRDHHHQNHSHELHSTETASPPHP